MNQKLTSKTTLLTSPAASATYTALSSNGSGVTASSFDDNLIGRPSLFLALAALRWPETSDSDVWKKWPALGFAMTVVVCNSKCDRSITLRKRKDCEWLYLGA